MRKTTLAFLASRRDACRHASRARQPWRQSSSTPQSPTRSLLTVEGNGQAEAKPDYARLTVELLAKAPTIEGAVEASKTLVPRVDTLLQSLKSEGVETESSHFSIGETPPPHPAPNGPQTPAAFVYGDDELQPQARKDRSV